MSAIFCDAGVMRQVQDRDLDFVITELDDFTAGDSCWPWFCSANPREVVMQACIEPAKEKDLPRMAALLGHLFAQEVDFKPDLEAQMRGLRRILAHPEQGQLLVAREDGEILGMVSLLWTTSTALGDPVAWLEDMVVDPGLRGRGLGKGLLNAAITLCRDRGIQRITLLTDADNIPAQTLYRSCGFEPSAMVPLRLRL